MTDAKAGLYEGCIANPDTIQTGMKREDMPEMLLQFHVPALEVDVTVVLYFSESAAPYSTERLRATGWEGKSLDDFTGIGRKPVTLLCKQEPYEGKITTKWEIFSGGTFNTQNPIDKKSFAARVAAITGNAAVAGKSGVKPPF